MELKEQIIDATIEEFNEKGLKFTMDDVSRRLGISKRTLYTVVEDKESLFLDAVDYGFAAVKESERKIIEDNKLDIVEKIKRILIVLPDKYKMIDFRKFYGIKEKFPRTFAKVQNKLETDWEPTFQLLEQAMEQGKIKRINLFIFQAMISGTIEHFLGYNTLSENGVSYNQALEEMIEILMNGIVVNK